jgi:hypothetical protein
MVSARMSPQNAAVLPKAKNGDMAAMHDAVVLVVKAGTGEVATVSTPLGQKFSMDEDVQSAEIAEYIEVSLQNPKKKYVLIQGEPRVKTSQIVRVQMAVGSVIPPDQEILIAVEH